MGQLIRAEDFLPYGDYKRILQSVQEQGEVEKQKPFGKEAELNKNQGRLIKSNTEMKVERHTDVFMEAGEDFIVTESSAIPAEPTQEEIEPDFSAPTPKRKSDISR